MNNPSADVNRPAALLWISRWIPLALVLLVCAVLLHEYGTPVRAIGATALYYAAMVVLPGTLLWRLFPVAPRSFMEQVAVGSALALAIQAVLRWLLSSVGAQSLTPLWAVAVVLAVSFMPRWRHAWRYDGPVRGNTGLSWVTALVVVASSWWLTNTAFRSNPILPLPAAGQYYPSAPYIDMPYQQSLASAVNHPWPLMYPYVPDTPLKYTILPYEHFADLHQWSGADLTLVIMRLHTLPLLALSIVLIAVLAARVADSQIAGVLGALFGTLSAPMSLYGWTWCPFFETGFLNYGTYRSPTQTFGEPLFLALLFLIVVLLTPEQKRRNWILIGPIALVAFAAAGSKATFLPMILCGVGLAALAASIWARQKLPRLVAIGVVGVAAMAIALVTITGTNSRSLELGDGRQYLLFTPVSAVMGTLSHLPALLGAIAIIALAWLSVMVGVVFLLRWQLRDPRMWLLLGVVAAGLAGVILGVHPGKSQLYFLRGAWPVLGVLSAWGIAVACRRTELSPAKQRVLVAGALVLGMLAVVGVRHLVSDRPDPDGMARWWAFFYPYAILVVALGLVAFLAVLLLKRTGYLHQHALLVGCLLVVTAIAGGTLVEQFGNGSLALNPKDVPAANGPAITADNAEAARWVRSHADGDEIIATNAHCADRRDPADCDARRFSIAALSEVPVYLEGWSYSNPSPEVAPGFRDIGPFWNAGILAMNDAAFYDPDNAKLDALRDEGVRFLVVDRTIKPESPELASYATLVFERPGAAVYDIEK